MYIKTDNLREIQREVNELEEMQYELLRLSNRTTDPATAKELMDIFERMRSTVTFLQRLL